MRIFATLSGVVALSAIAGAAQAQVTAFNQDFESDSGFSTSVPQFSDGSGDFFLRTGGSLSFGSFVNYNGADGDFFAGMDLDGEGATLPLSLTTDTFSISGLTDLNFSVDLAEDQDGTNEDWDDADFVDFEYSVDGGAWTNIFSVLPIDDGTLFNQEPAIGGLAGNEITDTFQSFTAALTGVTGNTMAIRAVFQLDSGDEDLALDNITVSGVPAPGAVALLGVAGLAGMRRRRA